MLYYISYYSCFTQTQFLISAALIDDTQAYELF